MHTNLLNFCTLIMSYQKWKSRKNPIYNRIKKNKMLRNKFNQEGERFVLQKLWTLMKETQDDRNKLKDTPCSWIRRFNIIKMSMLTKAVYRCNAILQITWYFSWNKNKSFKISMEPQMIIKTVWYWHKNTDQWSRIENPNINLHTYGQFMTNEAII